MFLFNALCLHSILSLSTIIFVAIMTIQMVTTDTVCVFTAIIINNSTWLLKKITKTICIISMVLSNVFDEADATTV